MELTKWEKEIKDSKIRAIRDNLMIALTGIVHGIRKFKEEENVRDYLISGRDACYRIEEILKKYEEER